MSTISIDFYKAMRQADKLDDQAENLRNMARGKYNESMQMLAGNWQSESADEFFKKADRLRREIESTAKDLEIIAGNLRRAAKRIYEAEKKAQEIARRRTSRQ